MGRVVGHSENISLTEVHFYVNPKGRDYVRKTGRKFVHAWVEGIVVPYQGVYPTKVYYNPKHCDFFTTGLGLQVRGCKICSLDKWGVTVEQPIL
jgi:hypothetical protein